MLFTNTYTYQGNSYAAGEDYYITLLQNRMWNDLPMRLGLNPANWNSFGRVYRNGIISGTPDGGNRLEGFIPQAYNNGQYLAANGQPINSGLFPNVGSVVSFFGQIDPQKRMPSGYESVKIENIWYIDSSLLTLPNWTSNNRPDDIIIQIIKNYINNNGCGLYYRETVRDMDKILERYTGKIKQGVLIKNMQPLVCVKYILEMIYNPYTNQITTGVPVGENAVQ